MQHMQRMSSKPALTWFMLPGIESMQPIAMHWRPGPSSDRSTPSHGASVAWCRRTKHTTRTHNTNTHAPHPRLASADRLRLCAGAECPQHTHPNTRTPPRLASANVLRAAVPNTAVYTAGRSP